MNERIRFLRKELHLTQNDLGQVIGISGAGVARIESGASRPTEAAIKLICATYHVSYRWLTEGIEPMLEAGSGDALIDRYAPDADEHLRAAIHQMASFTDDQWAACRDFIDYLVRAVDRMREDSAD